MNFLAGGALPADGLRAVSCRFTSSFAVSQPVKTKKSPRERARWEQQKGKEEKRKLNRTRASTEPRYGLTGILNALRQAKPAVQNSLY